MHRPCMMGMGEADRGVTTHLQDEFKHETKKMRSSKGNWKKPQDKAGRNTSASLKRRTASIVGNTIICMMFFSREAYSGGAGPSQRHDTDSEEE